MSSQAARPASGDVPASGNVRATPAEVTVQVPAKVNLALCVGPRRADGYHDLATVFQAVSLYDRLRARPRADGRICAQMAGEGSEQLSCDQTNLVVRAAWLLRERYPGQTAGKGVDLAVDKQIPMAGGMAGGSADAAGTLLACNRLWGLNLPVGELAELGAELGSDVSFLLYGGNALGLGRGEQLTPLAASGRLEWVFATARRGLATPLVYRRFDEMADRGAIVPDAGLPDEVIEQLSCGIAERVAACLRNDLQAPALELYPELAQTLRAGATAGALATLVSGSGPTCAFLAADAAAADRLAAELPKHAPEVRDVRRAYGPVSGPSIVDRA